MSRKYARELAMKAIYQMDVGQVGAQEALANVSEEINLAPADREFMESLTLGASECLERLDGLIGRFSAYWAVDRLSRVDRAVLRLALFELLEREDIPTGVSVNEAVELCKRFSGDEAGRFVNGILGGVVRHLELQQQES